MSETIRIGTMVRANRPDVVERAGTLAANGFESIQPFFWRTAGGQDLREMGRRMREEIGAHGAVVDSVGVFGNPLEDGEEDLETLRTFEAAIDAAGAFGARNVAGFTGRIRGRPIEESLPRFGKVWSELARRAEANGVTIAFENCAMDGNWQTGDWNIAHTPDHWEMMFNEVPAEVLGLEWEPCHQLVALIDPMPQIRKWGGRIFHVHGKDATIRHDVIREHGIIGRQPFAFMRTPGFGDSNWTDIISELRLAGYRGSIDIEGWHDPVYRDGLEMTGQVRALSYLKACRGGSTVTAFDNPA